MNKLEVIASFDWLKEEETIGVLGYDKLPDHDVYSFEYSRQWIKDHPDIMLGKDLQLFPGKQFSQPGKGIFGCFSDSLPDHWGRVLIELKEMGSLNIKDRLRFKLSDWDYLQGVQDILRIGGLRFKNPDTGKYLNASDLNQVPPVLNVEELYQAARKIEEGELTREGPDRQWVERLFKPGSSVGGARPKACVSDGNDLYIAKFPSTIDRWNEGRWEFFANKMAEQCGICTTETKTIRLSDNHDIFLSKRFDRTSDGQRIHMASALNLLGLTLDDKDHHGYSEIVDLIVAKGTNVEQSLQELYRRVAFTICIGNADDHLKNHSFLLTRKGWVLSPVYDINPSVFSSHSLRIDGLSNESSLDRLYAAHELYHLDSLTAYNIIKDVTRSMKYWQLTAKDCGISSDELLLFSDRFEEGMSWDHRDHRGTP